MLGDLVGQGHPGGLRCALAHGHDPAVGAVHPHPLAGQQPGHGQQAERLVVDLDRLADPADQHRLGGVAGQLGEGLQTGAEALGRLLVAQLVEPGDGVAVGRVVVVLEHREDLALDPLGHDVLPAAGLVVDVLPLEPDDVDEQPLGEPVLAHDAGGEQAAVVGQLEVAVAGQAQQAVALHAGHRLRDGRAGVAQPLGDAGAQRA